MRRAYGCDHYGIGCAGCTWCVEGCANWREPTTACGEESTPEPTTAAPTEEPTLTSTLAPTRFPTVAPGPTPAPAAAPTAGPSPASTPAPVPCVVKGYYYEGAGSPVEVQSLSWKDCQQLCHLSFSCQHFSFWPDGGCDLQDYTARLVDSDRACVKWTAKQQNTGKLCAGDYVMSGPKSCEDSSMFPQTAGLQRPKEYSTPPPPGLGENGTDTSGALGNGHAAPASGKSKKRGGLIWVWVLVPLLVVSLLVLGSVMALRMGVFQGQAKGQPRKGAAAGERGRQRQGAASAQGKQLAVGQVPRPAGGQLRKSSPQQSRPSGHGPRSSGPGPRPGAQGEALGSRLQGQRPGASHSARGPPVRAGGQRRTRAAGVAPEDAAELLLGPQEEEPQEEEEPAMAMGPLLPAVPARVAYASPAYMPLRVTPPPVVYYQQPMVAMRRFPVYVVQRQPRPAPAHEMV